MNTDLRKEQDCGKECQLFVAAGTGRFKSPAILSFSALLGPGTGALVRLRRRVDKAVRVRFCAVKNRAVSNRNCVAAMRGGEQRGENDQSVISAALLGCHRELDSVGGVGRVC